MTRQVIKNIALLVLLNLMVKPFFIIGIDAEVQNRVGAEAFGQYFALLNLSYLLNIVLDLGFANYLTRKVAQSPASAKQLSALFATRLMLVIPYTVITFLLYLALGYPLSQESMYLISLLMICQLLVAGIQFSRAVLSGLHLFATDRLISVSDRLMLIVLCVWMLWGQSTNQVTVKLFVELQVLAYGITAIVSLFSVRKYLACKWLGWKALRVTLKETMPFALLTLLMMAYTRTDALMIERLDNDGAFSAGIYAMGYRLLDAVNMMVMLVGVVLLPVFSKMLAEKQSSQQLVGFVFRLFFAVVVLLAVICFFWPQQILALRYHQWTEMAAEPFAMLMIGFVGTALTYLYGTLLTAANDMAFLNKVALVGFVLNIVANAVLIPEYGVVGAAFATMATQCSIAVFHITRSSLLLKMKTNVKLILSAVLFVIALFAVAWALKLTELAWYYNVALLVPVALILWGICRLAPAWSERPASVLY